MRSEEVGGTAEEVGMSVGESGSNDTDGPGSLSSLPIFLLEENKCRWCWTVFSVVEMWTS